MDLLILTGAKKENGRTLLQFQKAGKHAAAKVYGTTPHPKVQVVPMHTGTYQRTKRSRNFLAGHISAEAVVITGNPERWHREPEDLSYEPLFARLTAIGALKATTILGEWRSRYPEEPDELVLQAKSAIQNAHQTIASQAGLTIARKETMSNLRSRLRRKGWNLPKTEIQLQQYNWYDKHAFDSLPSFVFHPTMTAVVRRDVQNVLGTSPTLHTDAKKRWERWKKSRSNQARCPRARE